MTVVVITYVLGLIIATGVYSWRAGVSIMMTPFSGHRITARYPAKRSITGNITGGAGMKWWTVRTGKAFVWPVILAVWLANGRPEPSVQFNELAEGRLREEGLS